MVHVKVMDRWGKMENQHQYRRTLKSELRKFDPLFTAIFVDDYLQIRAQNSEYDTTALTSPVWDTTIDALGFAIGAHTVRTSVPRENIKVRYRDCCTSNRPRAGERRQRGRSLVWPENSLT